MYFYFGLCIEKSSFGMNLLIFSIIMVITFLKRVLFPGYLFIGVMVSICWASSPDDQCAVFYLQFEGNTENTVYGSILKAQTTVAQENDQWLMKVKGFDLQRAGHLWGDRICYLS